jgi:hypothetical protein
LFDKTKQTIERKNTMKKLLFIIVTSLLIQVSNAQTDSVGYFGQTPPGDNAVVFARDIISLTNRWETKIAFSPDGNECYFEVSTPDYLSTIYYKKRVNNTWTEQMEAKFSENHNVCDPFFSADGKRLYFCYETADFTRHIWFVERTTGEWGEPQLLPSPINSSSSDWGYTETTDGTAYVSSSRPGGIGDPVHGDIWCIPYNSSQAENLGPVVNSIGADDRPCIAPDGSFLIFNTNGHSNCWNDLFITFNKGNNGWTAPLEMNSCGAKINIHTEVQWSPSLSPDGKFLFFSRLKANATSVDPMDIYWVSTHVIVGLKKVAFGPKLSNQIPAMSIKADTVFNYEIPRNTFSCEYGTDSLQYSAGLSNGSALPSWLTFNAETRTLSGTPKQAEVVNLKIIATNADTVSATCTFKITVTKATGIEESNNNLPTEFKLCQNYPNPFNPSTVISYKLPVDSNVKLKIYDTLGREVKSLVDSYQGSGNYSLIWDATDDNNNPVSSGVYFYKLEAGEACIQKKMVLVR